MGSWGYQRFGSPAAVARLPSGAKILGNITVGKNCRIGAGSVVLRNVPDNSTVVEVPGHIILREGKRVVIIDPKQINDPLSEALASVGNEVHKLRERVQQLEGAGVPYEPLSESLQRIWKISTTRFSPTWTNMDRSERTSDLRLSELRRLTAGDTAA